MVEAKVLDMIWYGKNWEGVLLFADERTRQEEGRQASVTLSIEAMLL
jgi:hypothetical protein